MSINLSAKRLFDRVWFGKLAGVDAQSGTEVIGPIIEPISERAKLIADIIVGVFGDDTDDLLSDGGTDGFDKLWDEAKYKRHPKGARFGGRFAPKNTAEAIVAVHGAIDEALSGARTEESASELVDLLSNLTVNQLRDIKLKYKISASGRLKGDLVTKIAERLNAGRRADHSISPAPSRPFHPAVSASTEEQNVIGGWMAYVEDLRAESVPYPPEQQRKRDAMTAVLQGKPLSADQHAAAVEYLNTIYNNNRGQFGVGIADRDRHTDAAGSLLQKLGVDAEAVFMANNPNASPRRVAPAPVRRAPQIGVEIPPVPIVAPVVDRSPMGHRFTSVTTGKDNTSMVQTVLTSPQFSADQIDLLIDVVPGTEYGQLTELIAAVRPELSAAAQSAVNERNAQASAVRSQMEARAQAAAAAPVSRLTSREERMARARAEVEASRAIGQAAENASRNLNTQVIEPPRLTVPDSTEYTRDQIERRLLLDRARRVLQSGSGGITKDRYNRLLAEHEALAAPVGWDAPQAMVMRGFTSEFFSRASRAFTAKSNSDCGANAEGGHGFQPGNTCGEEDGEGAGKAPHTPAPNQRSMKFKDKKKGPDPKPEQVNKVAKIQIPNEPVNAAINALKSADVHEILRLHRDKGDAQTKYMAKQYEELADLIMDTSSDAGGEGVNKKKQQEMKHKAALWNHLKEQGEDGIIFNAPEPEPFDESETLADVMKQRSGENDITNHGVQSSPQSWDDVDSYHQEQIGRSWQREMLSDDDMQQQMWEAANDDISESDVFDENIEDLIAENSDSLDSVRDDYSSLIEETEKTIEASDDKETMRLKQRELVTELTAKAVEDESLADELMRQRVILDTHKRLNDDEYEFKTPEEQIREFYENGEEWIQTAVREKTDTEIESKISGQWGKDWISEKWGEIDSDEALQYAQSNGYVDEGGSNDYEDMDDQDFANLGWAPDGSDVTIRGDEDGVNIEIDAEGLGMERTLHKNENYIKNDSFFLDDDGPYKGQGGAILAQQVMHAMDAGYDYIETDPGRSSGMNGYYSWFTLGYDFPTRSLSSNLRDSIKDRFPNAKSVQDIFAEPGGKDWWLVHGEYVHGAKFDLTPGSRSLKVLRDNMRARKKK